jgi:hypothetical protein
LIGAGAGAVEGFVGYTVARFLFGGKWNKREALVAAGCGAVVGFISPWAAFLPGKLSIIATLGLFGTMNVAQYAAIEMINGKKPTLQGISWAIITGIASGAIAGAEPTIKNMYLKPPRYYIVSSRHAFKTFEELYQLTYRNVLARMAWKNVSTNVVRSLLASVTSNITDYSSQFIKFLKSLWKEKTGYEWSGAY